MRLLAEFSDIKLLGKTNSERLWIYTISVCFFQWVMIHKVDKTTTFFV